MNTELLAKLKKNLPEGRSKDRYHGIQKLCPKSPRATNQVEEIEDQVELNLSKDIKGNRKGFYKYLSNKRRSRGNVGPFLKETVDLVSWDNEKVIVLNAFFA